MKERVCKNCEYFNEDDTCSFLIEQVLEYEEVFIPNEGCAYFEQRE